MARREVLVQLDDELVEGLDAVARRRGTNRSALLRACARAFLDGVDEAEADARLQDAYRRQPQDEWVIEAGFAMARQVTPPW